MIVADKGANKMFGIRASDMVISGTERWIAERERVSEVEADFTVMVKYDARADEWTCACYDFHMVAVI